MREKKSRPCVCQEKNEVSNTSHRSTCLPLLRFRPGGVQRELVVCAHRGAKLYYNKCNFKFCALVFLLLRHYFGLFAEIKRETLQIVGHAGILSSTLIGVGQRTQGLVDEAVHLRHLHIFGP